MTLLDLLSSAVVGAVAGPLAGATARIITIWYNAHKSKQRDLMQRRAEQIADMRMMLVDARAEFDTEDLAAVAFGTSRGKHGLVSYLIGRPLWADLERELTDQERAAISSHTIIAAQDAEQVDLKQEILTKAISRLEARWRLI